MVGSYFIMEWQARPRQVVTQDGSVSVLAEAEYTGKSNREKQWAAHSINMQKMRGRIELTELDLMTRLRAGMITKPELCQQLTSFIISTVNTAWREDGESKAAANKVFDDLFDFDAYDAAQG